MSRGILDATICKKIGFPSRTFARRAAKRALKAGKTAARLDTYLCPSCGYWHLTRQRQVRR